MKTPIRTCVVCKQKFNKNFLLRINYKNNEICLDPKGNMPGRGAYVCKNKTCMERLFLKNLGHSFKTNIYKNYTKLCKI